METCKKIELDIKNLLYVFMISGAIIAMSATSVKAKPELSNISIDNSYVYDYSGNVSISKNNIMPGVSNISNVPNHTSEMLSLLRQSRRLTQKWVKYRP